MAELQSCPRAKKAVELFKEGYNCSQSVFGAFADEFGLDKNTALKIASGFGGGMGRLRETCGAVTGGIMVLGMKYGYDDASRNDIKSELYAAVQDFAAEFKAEFGTCVCSELLKTNNKSSVPTPRTEEFYKVRPCARFIEASVRILEEKLMQ